MLLPSWTLQIIADNVFGHVLDHSGITDRIRSKLGREPTKLAFQGALSKAFERLEKQYPQWVTDLFNLSFLEHEGAPILAQFLIRNGHPDPSELAMCWADSLNFQQPQRRSTLIRELEPIATDFLDYLAQSLYEELLGRDYLFALRCLGDNIPVRPKVMQRLIKRLADELLYSTDAAKFERYQQALSERLDYLKGSEGASTLLPPLVSALQHDTDSSVRNNAAQSLGQLASASPEALAALVSALQHDADSGVRYSAAGSLGQLATASPEVLAALVSALQHDADSGVRYSAAGSLAQLGRTSSEVIEMLLEALCKNESESYSARLLAQFGLNESESIRRDSARLLAQFGQSDDLTVKAILEGLLDESTGVRTACTQALAQLGRRFPDTAETIEKKLVVAIKDSEFDKTDDLGQSGHDYAYEGLWLVGRLRGG